jgi:capsular polysaccharide biosynthesis protein
VLGKVPGRPTAKEVSASPFLASAGGQVLPVIQLAAMAPSKESAKKLNQDVFKSLSAVIERQQAANEIGKGQRIELKLIDAPEAALTSPRKKTAAILVLFLALLGTVAVCHLLEGLRPRPDDTIDGIVDWDVPLADEPEDEDEARVQAFEFSGRRQQ